MTRFKVKSCTGDEQLESHLNGLAQEGLKLTLLQPLPNGWTRVVAQDQTPDPGPDGVRAMTNLKLFVLSLHNKPTDLSREEVASKVDSLVRQALAGGPPREEAPEHTTLFGRAVFEARTRLGLSVADAAEKLSCSPEMVEEIESGRRTPEGGFRTMVMNAFGIRSLPNGGQQ